jgi:hypothetical protein
MVLHALGARPRESGRKLLAGLSALGIQATACTTHQLTRTNLEIVEDDGTVTEILEPGSVPSPAEWKEFERGCRNLFAEGSEMRPLFSPGACPRVRPPTVRRSHHKGAGIRLEDILGHEWRAASAGAGRKVLLREAQSGGSWSASWEAGQFSVGCGQRPSILENSSQRFPRGSLPYNTLVPAEMGVLCVRFDQMTSRWQVIFNSRWPKARRSWKTATRRVPLSPRL